MSLAQLQDRELLSTLKDLAQDERDSSLRLIQHLQEMELRKLYLRIGYPSLFEYVVKELGLSAGSAYRRIQAMRLVTDVPQLEEKIASGELKIVAAAHMQSFFQAEKRRDRSYSAKDKMQLIQQLKEHSVRDLDRELVKINPHFQRTERIRPLPDSRYELTFWLSEDLKNKLDELRHLLAHHNPHMTYAELIDFMADVTLKKYSPREKNHRPRRPAKPTLEVDPQARARVRPPDPRLIPAALRTEVWMRDGGTCSFKNPDTGQRCGSKHLLQIDHIQPIALGGKTERQNLRLLCSAHNLWRGALTFGKVPFH